MNGKRRTGPAGQIPAWKLALVDVLAIAVCLLIFAYFDHVRPSALTKDVTNQNISVPAQTNSDENHQAQQGGQETPDQQNDSQQADNQQTGTLTAQNQAATDWKIKFADQFVTGDPVVTENSYKSENVSVTLTKYTVPEKELTYYVQDIYVSKIECLRNVFAEDTYGKGITETVLAMDNRVQAIGAVNGDYYGHNSVGIVIRNGVLYRDRWGADTEVLVLFRDGTMKAYLSEKEFDAEAVMAAGAWQAWCFGPSFLTENGELRESYKRTNHDPRTVIGMIEPGHYLLIVIDGRQGSYSEGTTYRETAELCKELGCVVAYNLDGGKTSQMTFGGEIVNQPYDGGRKVSDLVYIADVD